ncbi:PREDICTED: 40S ribosomal protein S21-2-like isoform X1 [Nelumbo nucifera]|uniref:40S ribosomal protein S21-2-like isoform X1 n=1 Tax=Nelumbo nucifera TaxID=4432 RepID=A0A1U8ABX0_NELNU|nr:PREDICTED: 40S ribosomal protein S21-2-like isoform X1 [Nelumbo nucifera]
MQNEEGQNMDLYIPRKCSATNRLITSKDHASVQINIGHLDENGIYTGHFTTFALCGFVRAQVNIGGISLHKPQPAGEPCHATQHGPFQEKTPMMVKLI